MSNVRPVSVCGLGLLDACATFDLRFDSAAKRLDLSTRRRWSSDADVCSCFDEITRLTAPASVISPIDVGDLRQAQ